jgi:hypothetical protein
MGWSTGLPGSASESAPKMESAAPLKSLSGADKLSPNRRLEYFVPDAISG